MHLGLDEPTLQLSQRNSLSTPCHASPVAWRQLGVALRPVLLACCRNRKCVVLPQLGRGRLQHTTPDAAVPTPTSTRSTGGNFIHLWRSDSVLLRHQTACVSRPIITCSPGAAPFPPAC
jgi:hypothetical protein